MDMPIQAVTVVHSLFNVSTLHHRQAVAPVCTMSSCPCCTHSAEALLQEAGLRQTQCIRYECLNTLYLLVVLCLQVVQKVEYPLWVVYVTQALMFGGGLLGITYGILSTSWDPRREGSALGWTELQANLPILLNRNKDRQQ